MLFAHPSVCLLKLSSDLFLAVYPPVSSITGEGAEGDQPWAPTKRRYWDEPSLRVFAASGVAVSPVAIGTEFEKPHTM